MGKVKIKFKFKLLFLCKTIKAADIATVRKLAKPPHLIMRIMDAALILFQRPVDKVQQDPDRPTVKPSWGEALKVNSETYFKQFKGSIFGLMWRFMFKRK